MAGTYGEPGKNNYAIRGISGLLSNVVNSETGVTQIYKTGAANTYQSIGTYNPSTNSFTPSSTANLSQTEINALSSNKTQIKSAAVQTAEKAGATNATQLLNPSAASGQSSSSTNQSAAGSTANSESLLSKGLTKESAQGSIERTEAGLPKGPLVYPINRKNGNGGDFIHIEMRSYKKSGFQSAEGSFTQTRMEDRDFGQPLAHVYLPIQSGITDSISVDWGNGELNPITAQFANLAMGTILEAGKGDLGSAAGKFMNNFGAIADKFLGANSTPDLQKLVANYFTEQAVGVPGLLSRSIGGAVNNNLELLFNGPTLRSFTFNFRLTPREAKEAAVIKEIIRLFKRGMTPALSKSGLFLSAPNVFKLKYLYTGNGSKAEDHPYLNKIKIAALRDFSVNYTPDGNYMTYADGGSMTSYDLSMTFGEIDPVYANDYEDKQGKTGMGW